MWRLVAPFTIPHVNHLLKGHHADFRFAHINPKKVTRRERGTYQPHNSSDRFYHDRLVSQLVLRPMYIREGKKEKKERETFIRNHTPWKL
jgi:hypothetical protein